MAFPTIPTVAAGRILTAVQANTTATRTFPSLTGLTKDAGDLLIAICIAYQSSVTDTAFSGWTGGFTEFEDESTTTDMAIGCAYKFSTGSETGTFAVTQAATITGQAVFILLSISGAHASTVPEAGGFVVSTTTTMADATSLNPAGWNVEDTLWIAVGGDGETSTTGSYTGISAAPTSYTDLALTAISQDAVGGVHGGVAFRQLAAAAEDQGAWTADTSNSRHAALAIAVRTGIVGGTALGAFVFTGTADGVVEIPGVSGTAEGNYTFTGTVTGRRESDWSATASDTTEADAAVLGTAVGAYTFSGTSSGIKEVFGVAAGNFSFSGTASGTKEVFCTSSASLTFTGTSLGTTTKVGVAAGSFTFTGTALGTKTVLGTALGAYTFTGAASGEVGTPPVQGAALGAYTFTGTASGTKEVFGVAAGSYTFTGQATGTREVLGQAVANNTFSGTASGIPTVFGQAVGNFIFTGAANGIPIPPVLGSAQGAFVFSGTATGVHIVQGQAAGTYDFNGAAFGTVEKLGQAQATFTFVGTALGILILPGLPRIGSGQLLHRVVGGGLLRDGAGEELVRVVGGELLREGEGAVLVRS